MNDKQQKHLKLIQAEMGNPINDTITDNKTMHVLRGAWTKHNNQ